MSILHRHSRSKFQAKRRWAARTSSAFRTNLEALERRQLLAVDISWSAGPDLPAPVTDAAALVAPDNAIYILGGDSAAPAAVARLSESGTSWESAPHNIDTQRNDLGAIRSGNSIFLFGGTGNDEGSDEVLDYDYRFGDSQDLAKMDLVRYDHGFAADAAGRAYALGGIGVFGDGEIWQDAERYDPTSDSWTPIASLPQALHGLSAIGDGNGHIFVFGGSTTLDDSGIQRTSYSYDIATDSWSTVAPLPIGTRDSAVAMDDDGSIYVIGGMTTSGATDAVQQYDPATNAWTAQTALPAPVYSLAATFGPGGKIIVVGGFDAAGNPTDAVYETQNLTVPDIAPVISTSPVSSGSLDTFYTYDVNASGNPVPTFSLVTGPAGMTVDEATGVLSWQPVAGQVGVHSVVVQASNRAGSVDQAFDITVVADTIAPTTPANFTFDSATQTSVTFGWDASADAVGVDHYDLATAAYVGPRFGKHWVYTVVDSVTTTTWTHNGLAPLSTEDYAVRAVDAAGNVSAWSPRVFATTLAAPDISFSYGTQTTGTIQSPALTAIEIQLSSHANPAATFSLVSGPAAMTVNPTTGLAQWTPDVADIGLHDATFRATNSEGTADLTVSIDVLSDVPQLSVQFDPATGGTSQAGVLFTAQVVDHSSTPSTYSLVSAPTGMTIDSTTGTIQWTPTGDQGGQQSVTVRGVNAGGTTDLTFGFYTLFTGAVTGVTVTGTSLAEPTAHWVAPTGEGSDLVSSYQVHGFAEWGVGRTYTTHTVDYTVAATETSVLMSGLVTGKSYSLTVTALDAADNRGVANNETNFVSSPALPIIRWTVNGYSGGSSLPGQVIAEQPAEVVLTDEQTDPSTIVLVSGPSGLTFDAVTGVANWTPTANQITTGYTTTDVTFEATNSVGSVSITVPIRVFFSGTVRNALPLRNGYSASATWDPPTDNATPIAAYSITRYWTFAGSHHASATWTVPGDVTSITFQLGPTGAVSHKGISIAPVDEFGNLGVSTSTIAFGSYQNELPPIAVDDTFDATEDTNLLVSSVGGILSNDIDPDNTPGVSLLSAQLVSGPANGTLILGSNGSVSYTPNADFYGTDTFVYRVYDGLFYSDNAAVTINVASVNDAPAALDDYYFADYETPLTVNAAAGVSANDSDADGDNVTVAVFDNPANGSVSLNADGSFIYTPNAGFAGIDTFTYIATDTLLDSRIATVSIEVTLPTNVAPTASITGTTDIYRGETVTFTLNASDPSPIDQADLFTFEIDWDGNGTVDETLANVPSGTTVQRAFPAVLANDIQVRATDRNASTGEFGQTPITVSAHVLRDDGFGNIDLIWGGTDLLDAVYIIGSGPALQLFVQYEGLQFVNRLDVIGAGVTGKIILHGYGFSDVLIGEFATANVVEIHGGEGDDVIVGGFLGDELYGDAGGDVILGGTQAIDGDDYIEGGEGRDTIFGHWGADTLDGGGGQDLLISDRYGFADTAQAVQLIANEWRSARPYAERVTNILGITSTGVNGTAILGANVTVADDGATDTLIGGLGDIDWFIYDFDQDLLGDVIETDEEETDSDP